MAALAPLLSCSVSHTYSYPSASFSDNGKCITSSLFAALEARLSDMEVAIRTLQSKHKASLISQPPLAGAGPLRAAPKHPGNPGRRATVPRKHLPEQKPSVHHPPVHVSNRFSPLRDTPTEKTTSLIGCSSSRDVTFYTPAAIVKRIPGAERQTLNQIESCWQEANLNTVRL